MAIIIMNFWFLHVFQLSAVIIAFDGQNILSLSTDSFVIWYFSLLIYLIGYSGSLYTFSGLGFLLFFFKYPLSFLTRTLVIRFSAYLLSQDDSLDS